MISQEVTQRNVWPYLIGLGLILLAFLLGWMANEALQMDGLQVNIGSAPVAATAVDPADRKYYTNEYGSISGEAKAADPLANVDPADRKFFTRVYAAGGQSGEVDPPADVHPADRKFFNNGDYGLGTP